jgi:hypothetical protein
MFEGRDQREAHEAWDGIDATKRSHSPLLGEFLRGEGSCQDRAVLGRAVRVVLTGPLSPRIIVRYGEWDRTHTGAEPFRDPLVRCSSSATDCLARCFCLSPRFYPQSLGPASPLLDGVPRLGGALLSLPRPPRAQECDRSLPHSDGYALLRCQSVLSFFPPCDLDFIPLTAVSFVAPLYLPMPRWTAYYSAAARRPLR